MKDKIKEAIETTLVVDNKQSIDLCVDKIINVINRSGFVEVNDKSIDEFVNVYINHLPQNWNSSLDLYLAMKNAILEALSYPDKYIIKKQNG